MAASKLDHFFPRWDFRERHRTRLTADAPEPVIRAVTEATWGDFPVFRTIFSAASVGRRRPPKAGRVFDNFLGTGPALARSDDEVVYGWIVHLGRRAAGRGLVSVPPEEFAGFDRPHTVKIGFNFRHVGDVLVTETRVCAADSRTRALFRPYFLAVRLPGGLIRREWLRGIRRRAARSLAERHPRTPQP